MLNNDKYLCVYVSVVVCAYVELFSRLLSVLLGEQNYISLRVGESKRIRSEGRRATNMRQGKTERQRGVRGQEN